MRPHRDPLAVALAVASFAIAGACARRTVEPLEALPATASAPGAPATIAGHPVRLDARGQLLSWSTADSPYAHVASLAWHALETKFPVQDNGVETWLAHSRFDPVTFEGVNWPHNPAGLYAMLTDSAVLWYAFSGDRAAIDLARKALAYQLAHGTTPGDWQWARVPYASANADDVEYRGADDSWCDGCGSGDGPGVIEPDKIGELGFAYLQMFEVTGDARLRDAAIACADALATHVRPGDWRRSPWPFRVHAATGGVREEYSANVVGALMLFDELGRLSLGNVRDYAAARATALAWLLRVPMNNDAWSGYFEDIAIAFDPGENPNQYAALRTARWLMAHPDDDPAWRDHAAHLLSWTATLFGVDTPAERGSQYGALVMSEQARDMAKMGSHTARFGATSALWAAATGDRAAREIAAHSLDWATYICREDGVVAVGEDERQGWWFSDGYGDYIRHFLVAMGAVPEWGPSRENHLVRSTSVVREIAYRPGRVEWSTFDGDATDTLRLTSRPLGVTAAGLRLRERRDLDGEGFVVRSLAGGGAIVRVRHRVPGTVVVRALTPASARVRTDP